MLGKVDWKLWLAVYAAVTASIAIIWDLVKWRGAGPQAARVKRDVARMEREAAALTALRARIPSTAQFIGQIQAAVLRSRTSWQYD